MNKVNAFSTNVCTKAGLPVDTVILVMIISAVIQILDFIRRCKRSNKEVLSLIKNPGPFTKLLIQSQVRRKIRGKTYNKYGAAIVDAVLEEASVLTEDDLEKLILEAERKNG